MFNNVRPGEIVMNGVPCVQYHIWFCDECQKWHSELIRPVLVGNVEMVQNTDMFTTDTLAEMMAEIATLTLMAIEKEISSETAEILEAMWGRKFERLVQLYDAICVSFEKEGNDDH